MAANDLRLDDGFATFITFANMPTVKIWEKEVTPPGFTAGGPIDTTTMRNTALRTSAPRKLKTLTQVSATVAYATSALAVVNAQIGVNQLITIHYPDGSTLAFWGWLESFTPASNSEGNQPTAAIVVNPSNRDNDGAETAPIYTAPAESSGA